MEMDQRERWIEAGRMSLQACPGRDLRTQLALTRMARRYFEAAAFTRVSTELTARPASGSAVEPAGQDQRRARQMASRDRAR